MSGFECPQCHAMHDIFGRGGARQRAEDLQLPFLGQVPINIQIRISGDDGKITSIFDNPQASSYLNKICYQLVKGMAQSAAAHPPMPSLPVL
jgi:ATP-binding protein involved in chromosome partitioning